LYPERVPGLARIAPAAPHDRRIAPAAPHDPQQPRTIFSMPSSFCGVACESLSLPRITCEVPCSAGPLSGVAGGGRSTAPLIIWQLPCSAASLCAGAGGGLHPRGSSSVPPAPACWPSSSASSSWIGCWDFRSDGNRARATAAGVRRREGTSIAPRREGKREYSSQPKRYRVGSSTLQK